MSTGTGLNVSKANVYAILTKPAGVNVSKGQAYAILTKPAGVNVSKGQAYAVLTTNNSNPPVWTAFTFSNGFMGQAYSQQWDLSPAAASTTYTLASGSLPTGLSLTNVGGLSGDVGSISGTPTVAGTFSFSLTATNSYGSATQAFSITIVTPSSGGAFVFIA